MWGVGTCCEGVSQQAFKWKKRVMPQKPPTSPQDDKPRGESKHSVNENNNKSVAEPGYCNPDPLIWLIGWLHEVTIAVDGVYMTALIELWLKSLPS